MASFVAGSRMLRCAAVLMLCGVSGSAQVPLGPDFQVNTYTTGHQDAPDVQIRTDGGFVVVWSAGLYTDEGIRGQRFDAAGVPVDSEFSVRVPPATFRSTEPRVAISAPGDDFLVTWREYANPLDGEIRARLYSSDGMPLGGSFQVNTYATGDQREPVVAERGDEGFVVAWTSYGSPGTDTLGGSVQARLFDSDALPLGAQFQINDETPRTQRVPSIASAPGGGFVVAWDGGTLTFSVEAKRFEQSGAPVGPQFQVNNPAIEENELNSTTLAVGADEGFVVAWRKNNGYGGYHLNRVQVMSPEDERLGTFEVTTSDYYGGGPGLAAAADRVRDEFVIVSHSSGGGPSILGQRASKDGAPIGDEFVLNSYTPGGKKLARLDIDSQGGMVVVWEGTESPGTDSDSSSILGRRFQGEVIFLDGFESGDLSAWSHVVP